MATCFFLDSTIVLAEVLGQWPTRMDKFKQDVGKSKIPCYISDSVRAECDDKLEENFNLLGNVVREYVKLWIESSRRRAGVDPSSPITQKDILSVEQAFADLSKYPQLLADARRAVEQWIVGFMDRSMGRVGVDEFFRNLTMVLLDKVYQIKSCYDRVVAIRAELAQTISVSRDTAILGRALLLFPRNRSDAEHTASAATHQARTAGCTVVFVSLDYGHIIQRQNEIRRALNIWCCDPVYAIYHAAEGTSP